MATVYTHAVFGLGLGKLFTARRMPWTFWALAGFLPIVPDFDAFWAQVPYGSPFGHRGFTHSLIFALAAGAVAALLVYRRCGVAFLDLLGFYFTITASHGILDAFTNGGYGVAFFWPFDSRRYGPWGPIQVSDIAFEIPNWKTSRTVRTELLWVWLPLLLIVVAVSLYRRHRHRREEPVVR